jgi:hypothetical protein
VVRILKPAKYVPTANNVANVINKVQERPLPSIPEDNSLDEFESAMGKGHCKHLGCIDKATWIIECQKKGMMREYDICRRHRGLRGTQFDEMSVMSWRRLDTVIANNRVVIRQLPKVTQELIQGEPSSSSPSSYASRATQGLTPDKEGRILELRMKREAAENKAKCNNDLRSSQWQSVNRMRTASKKRQCWLPPVLKGEGDAHWKACSEQAAKDQGWHRIAGYCYIDAIKPHWRDNFRWPALPTVQQLNQLPECCKDRTNGAVNQTGSTTLHLVLGNDNGESIWTAIEALTNGPQWFYAVGMDLEALAGLPPALANLLQNMHNQIQGQQQQIAQQIKQINDLQDHNNQLQDQIEAMEAVGPPEPPPPFNAQDDVPMQPAEPAPELVPQPADPMQALIAAIQNMAPNAGPRPKPAAKEPEKFDGTMEKVESFILECYLFLSL